MKRFALGTAIFMACALAPVSNASVITSIGHRSALAPSRFQTLAPYLQPVAGRPSAIAAPAPKNGHTIGQLPVARTLAAGSKVAQTSGKDTPFAPDPVTVMIMISAFALIGTTLRERKHDGMNLPQG